MQIKTKMRYHFTPVRMAKIKKHTHTHTQETTGIGEDAEKEEPSYTVGGNANWHSHCGKQYGGFSKS